MKRVIGIGAALALTVAFAVHVFAAAGGALSAARDTPRRSGKRVSIGMADGVKIYAGGMVAVGNTGAGAGYATNAGNIAGLIVIGRAASTVDNTSGTNDQLTIEVDQGIFRWNNAGDISATNHGEICYIVDEQSVSVTTNGNDVIAGTVFDVDSSGVWVVTRDIDRTAGAFTTLSVSGASTLSGNATIAGTLNVTGAVTHAAALTQIGAATFASTLTSTGLVNGIAGFADGGVSGADFAWSNVNNGVTTIVYAAGGLVVSNVVE